MKKPYNNLLKIVVISSLSMFLNSCINPTSPSKKGLRTLWTKTYGGEQWEQGYSIQETTDGCFIIGGYAGHYYLGEQIYLIKTDNQGKLLWTKTYTGECYSDYSSSVQQTNDGGFIIAGNIVSSGNYNDCINLIKTDRFGNLQWDKSYENPEIIYAKCYSVDKVTNTGYIIAGYEFTLHGGLVYIIKTDEMGDTIWTKTYMEGIGHSIQETQDRDYILTGIAQRTYGGYTPYLFLMKIDKNGRALWVKTSRFAAGNSVKETTDGGYIITGWKKDYVGDDKDVYLVKTDSIGNFLWEKTYGGENEEVGNSVIETYYGGYIIAGYTTSSGGENKDVYLIKTDMYGNLLCSKTFGGDKDDEAYSIQEISDRQYIIVGSTYSFGAGYSDIYLIMLGN